MLLSARACRTALLVVLCAGSVLVARQAPPAGEKKDEGLPLRPDRTIELTTTEATWVSLDVSPDGRTLVLELLGDLYTLPIEGGSARPIMTGLPFDSQPRYSPDGRRIAFLSDRDGAENLWLANADGSEPKKLSKDDGSDFASPAWSSDGEYVIVSRQVAGANTYELWMYDARGGSGVQITKAMPKPDTPRNQRRNALGVVASPDGRYLYYARRVGGFMYNASFPLWQIGRRDTITGDEDVLTQAPGSAIRPALSRDGRLLAYATRLETATELRVRDLVTGEDRRLRYPVTRDDQESGFSRDLYPGYTFMPDGRELLTTFDGKIQRVDVATGAAREIPFSARLALPLGPRLDFPYRVDEGPVRARLIQDAVQSPDGKRLAFSALTHIYTMDLPAGAPRRVTAAGVGEFQPAWSPDGQWIAYVSWTADGGHVWKVRADGSGQPAQLTSTPAFYSDPAWSPDGARLVLLRGTRFMREESPEEFAGPDVPRDLVWLSPEGGDPVLVSPSRGLGKPHFTRDASRVYVYGVGFGPEDGGQGLVSMRLDGTDRREHLKVVGKGAYSDQEPVGADDARMSPDGKWALALVKNQLYLVAVPHVGGAAPKVSVDAPSVAVRRLTDLGADYFAWADDGRTITWAVGATFERVRVEAVDFDVPKPPEGATAAAPPPARKPLPVEQFTASVELPRKTPKGTVVLRGARLVTMKGDEIIENGDLVVTDNRIAAIGARGKVRVPAGATVIDIAGATILPGFVDTHAHWGELRKGILDVQNPAFLANLAYGVTAGLDVQTMTNDMFAYQDLVDAGLVPGPRAYSTGPGIFSNNDFKSLDEAKGVIRKYKERYRAHNLKSYLVGNRKQRQFVVMASKELGMMPTTEGGLDLKLDITHALDGFWGNEHSLPIVPLYSDVVQLFAQSKIGYTPTLLVNYGGPFGENFFYTTTEVHDDAKLSRFLPHAIVDQKTRRRQWFRKDEYAFPKTAASAAAILRAGGRIGVGSHGQLQGLGYHWEMWALAQGGLTPREVLRAATIDGAGMIGLAQDLGSLEPGKLADLVVLAKNPLVDLHNTTSIRFVMKNGELFDGDTMDQVWPEKRPLPPSWWNRR